MLLGSQYFTLVESSLTLFSLNGTWIHVHVWLKWSLNVWGMWGRKLSWAVSWVFLGERNPWGKQPELHIHKNTTCLLFWGCHQGTRPTDLHVYLEAKGGSLRALWCPVLQLLFCIRPFAKLSPAVSPTKSSLNPPSWGTTSCVSVSWHS